MAWRRYQWRHQRRRRRRRRKKPAVAKNQSKCQVQRHIAGGVSEKSDIERQNGGAGLAIRTCASFSRNK
jgi:hypothetical protein